MAGNPLLDVPARYAADVKAAAAKMGVSQKLVAAQINTESSFNPNVTSPTGAEGIAQFEPATWAQWGHGSPFNPADAFPAYADFMSSLISQYNGDLRNALAAYNAGPGNLAAGYGYADSILHAAGLPGGIDVGGGGGGAGSTFGGGLFGLPSQVSQFFSDLDKVIKAAMWLAAPSNWVRVTAGLLAFLFLMIGLYALSKAA